MAKQPALLACLACREKHLKCDGQKPRCLRCGQTGAKCEWTPSRRGYRGIRKRHSGTEVMVHPWGGFHGPNGHAALLSSQRKEFQLPSWLPQMDGHNGATPELIGLGLDFSTIDTNALQPVAGIASKLMLSQNEDQQLIDLYYANFHSAHPILPPARFLAQQPPFSPCLDATIKFIGSHFDPSISTDVHAAAVKAVFKGGEPHSYRKVQALLLFAIALHARNARAESVDWLDMAIDVALDIGLNRKDFAASHGINDQVVEESVRRTWWELYIVDGLIAALHQKADFKTSNVLTDVELPCEELVYLQGGFIPQPFTITQLNNRVFDDDELELSSFCYRIEAIRLLGRVMAVGGDASGKEDQVESIDIDLGGWTYHLPSNKREVLATDGTVDEMLFQAFMIVNCAIIYFHLPRSDLMAQHAPNASMPCAERLSLSIPASSPHSHAVKTTEAANKLSWLASLQTPAERHTPFFICSLVLDSVVQLSACSIKACRCLEVHRAGITLAIGVLKSLSTTWPLSQPALQQVKAVARMVLDIGVRPIDRQVANEDTVDLDSIISSEGLLGDTPDIDRQQIQLPI